MTKHALVGLLFLVALVALGVVTMKVTNVQDIVGEDPHFLTVEFVGSVRADDGRLKGGVGGLKRGDAVMVSGVQVGRVESVELEEAEASPERPSFSVTVKMQLKKQVQLRENYSLRITDSGLLGNKQIEIDPGVGAPTTDDPLRGELIPSALESLGDAVTRNAGNIDRALGDLRTITGQIRSGKGSLGKLIMSSTLHDRIESIATRVDGIAESIAEGPGLLPSLLTDRELRSNVQGFVASAQRLAEGLERGRGTVGRLLQEEGLYNDLADTVRSGRELVAGVKRGEGLLGVLFADEAVADRVRDFTIALSDRRSVLGKLMYDHQLASDLGATVADLRSVVGHVRAGRGSIGRLLMEDDVVNRIERALAAFSGSLEEARESAPVNAFLTSLFRWW